MLSITEAQFKSLGDAERTQLLATHYLVGIHPETRDILLMPLIDRFAGMYVLGVQGVGKSGFLVNQIDHDTRLGHAVIVIDPHGDLITQCIAHLPPERTAYTYVLDMEDVDYPFGLNPFDSVANINDPIVHTQAIDRVMHIFEVLWPDILSQAHLPRFLRAACIALMANPGTTLVDMLRFLLDGVYRSKLLQAVKDQSVLQFWGHFDALSASQQHQQVEPLVGRLESLFMGRSIVRNIVGQPETSINFRKAIEDREIIFIRLPLKTSPQDARLIGTLITAQIHAAIFSFADISEHQRPGFSLYVDEFQHFATLDFAEMFTEGRKFGIRVCLAHQFRDQLPGFLRHATMTARTKVCFQVTPDDAREMAHLYLHGEAGVKPEDIDPHPVEHLLKYGSDDLNVDHFIEWYLRPLQAQKHGGTVEITHPGFRADHMPYWLLSVEAPKEKPKVEDPTPYLNHLLHEVMKTGNARQYVDPKIIYGFSNCGRGFYSTFLYALNKQKLLTGDFTYPSPMIVEGANGLYCARSPESSKEQVYHFLFHLHATMAYLAANPIGKKSTLTTTEVAHMLTSLPKRAAFVRSGEDVGVMYTHDTSPWMSGVYLEEMVNVIREQTRQRYCRQVEESTDMTDTNEPPQPTSRWEEID